MRNTILFVIVTLLFTITLSSQNVQAQSVEEAPKFEVGGQYVGFVTTTSKMFQGFSGLFTYNFNKYLGADAAMSYLPKGPSVTNMTQGFFGPKLGLRTDKFGVFVKSKPGFLRLTIPGESTNLFAWDNGGILELYQSKRLAYRIDISNIFVNSSATNTNHVQVSAGVMLRF